MMSVLTSCTCITVFAVNETSSLHLSTLPPINWSPFLKALIRPLLDHRDFRLVFFSRFLYQLGIATVQQFLQYWISDCVSIGSMPSTQAVSYALLPLLILSPVGAACIPAKKRKVVVYVATVFFISTCVLMVSMYTCGGFFLTY